MSYIGEMDQNSRALYSMNQLSDELGITPRTIRFYEQSGLLAPQRVGVNRVFDRRDRARLMIILRGKRLGFSLQEIRDYLDLYESDRSQISQMRKLLESTRQKMAELEVQRRDLELTLAELASIERQALDALAQRHEMIPPDDCPLINQKS